MIVILDNGHGAETAGKCSPIWADHTQLKEYEFNRDVTALIAYKCKMAHIPFVMLVPEYSDISLAERVKRADAVYRKDRGAFLFSIHANAGGGTGWEAWTSKSKTKSDEYATILYEEAERAFGKEWKIRKDTLDGDPDKESQFYILKHTKCPAVLSENFFMDTERDCRFIMSHEGRERIAEVHFRAIKRIFDKYGKD